MQNKVSLKKKNDFKIKNLTWKHICYSIDVELNRPDKVLFMEYRLDVWTKSIKHNLKNDY